MASVGIKGVNGMLWSLGYIRKLPVLVVHYFFGPPFLAEGSTGEGGAMLRFLKQIDK